jgi:hypothetical protein
MTSTKSVTARPEGFQNVGFMQRLGGIRGSGHRVDHDARSRQRSVDGQCRPIRAGATRVRGAGARCCNARDRCAALARGGVGWGSAASRDTRRGRCERSAPRTRLPSKRRKEGAIGRPQRGAPLLSAEHDELMSQHEQFDVFRELAAAGSDEQPQNSREGEISEGEEHPPMLPEPSTKRSRSGT